MNNLINAMIALQKQVKAGRYIAFYSDFISVDINTFFDVCRAYHGGDETKLKVMIFATTTSIETVIEGVRVKVII